MKKIGVILLIFLLILTACSRKSEEEQIKEGMEKVKKEEISNKTQDDAYKKEKEENKNLESFPLLIDNSVTTNNYKIKILRTKSNVEGTNNPPNIVNITFLTKNKSGANINPLATFNQTFSVIQQQEDSNLELESVQTPPSKTYQSKIENQSLPISHNKTVISVISFKLNNLQDPIYIKSKNTHEVIIINPNNL